MAQASEDETGDFSVQISDMTPEQLAAVSIFGALLTGGVFSMIGLQLNVGRYQAALVIIGLLLVILIGTVFAVMRAMVISAEKDGDNPLDALTNPLFVVLFLFVAIAVSVFVGVYTWLF
ncbi:hypothetical protein SAMN06269185_0889 [Natronoarchaeum philippinense]|uniref:Uncharacterized protein n=1 Tax=Natronoarchaeum philippinense TaxID=558529 RepID=A0A285N7U5_NATPI|nr:hypothetical protein [Natronoarchaeum philippinense]SNZ05552.1 hypothetical protein SAMN06269185_0889 [Natronoarchaeum philippinense]